MDMRILGGLGAAALVAFIAFQGTEQANEQRASEIEKHALSQPQQAFMDACASDMRHNSVEFTMGGDNISGCACISNGLNPPSNGDTTPYYKLASETYEALLKSRKSVDQGMEMSRLAVDVATANKVSLGEVLTTTTEILDATKACGVRAEAVIEAAQAEHSSDRCARTTQEEHEEVRKILERSGKGYDPKTCTHFKLSDS